MIEKAVPLWRQILRNNFIHWEKLADFLTLDESQRRIIAVNPRFPLSLPLRLANKIVKGTIDDPILRQFLPTVEENRVVSNFIQDPVGDQSSRKAPKLLHKYQGRALLVCTSACAMHCRYCFRQNFDYDVADKTFEKEIETLAADETIHEVILSGGDPLSLSDELLGSLLQKISKIPHIHRIRFHTRFPIGIPERLDASFLSMIQKIPQQIWFVIHSNHPKELDQDVLFHLKQLQKQGVVILNQSVLLKGVNDSVETMQALCERLANNGILPYYVHQLDRVQGTAHFETDEADGKKILQTIANQLSGYAVPRYVREDAGEPGKTVLT